MMLADRLKKSVKEIMELSALEMDLWSAYIRNEQDLANKQAKQMKTRRR